MEWSPGRYGRNPSSKRINHREIVHEVAKTSKRTYAQVTRGDKGLNNTIEGDLQPCYTPKVRIESPPINIIIIHNKSLIEVFGLNIRPIRVTGESRNNRQGCRLEMEPARKEEWQQLNATTGSSGSSSCSEMQNINLNETPNEDQSMRESGGNENNPLGGITKPKEYEHFRLRPDTRLMAEP